MRISGLMLFLIYYFIFVFINFRISQVNSAEVTYYLLSFVLLDDISLVFRYRMGGRRSGSLIWVASVVLKHHLV